jgi:hypothetical protein
LIGLALILVAKHYVALEYIEEDEEKPIIFFHMPKEDKEEDTSSPFNSIHKR